MGLLNAKKVYLVGIKGQGMTALAQILKQLGLQVVGSDTTEKFSTDAVLHQAGIEFHEGFRASHLGSTIDLVVYSSAYNETNPEIAEAKKRQLPLMSFAESLGELTKQFKSIAIAGSHGKTTIAAMLSFVLKEADFSPTSFIGSQVPQFGGNALLGTSEWFIFEADEYQNKFQYFFPQAIVLTSIDWDHPDFYPTPQEYYQAFVNFLRKIPPDGFVVVNYDSELVRRAVGETLLKPEQIVSYGLTRGYWQLLRTWLDQGHWHFSLTENGEFKGDFWLRLIGVHNVANALAVIACARRLGIDLEVIRKTLTEFEGIARRFAIKGKLSNQVLLVDDFAHHPQEITATLKGARDFYPYKNIRVVFHPHTFSRTKALLNDFAQCFIDADEVIVLDIYGSAREGKGDITSQDLVKEISRYHPAVAYKPTIDEATDYLLNSMTRSDLIITMGAGDVWQVGENLIVKLGLATDSELNKY